MNKSEKFNKSVQKYMAELNSEGGKVGYRWGIETPLGFLSVTVHTPEPRQKVFSIFMRFEEPERAKVEVACNPFSGKWNIHENSPEDALKELNRRICGLAIKGERQNEVEIVGGSHYCNVIVSKQGLLEENHLVVSNSRSDCGDKAEALFVSRIEALAESRSLEEEMVENALSEGYIELPHTETMIMLSWPEVKGDD